jgi:hypothetical protein
MITPHCRAAWPLESSFVATATAGWYFVVPIIDSMTRETLHLGPADAFDRYLKLEDEGFDQEIT